jgi:hypothetical protein
MHQHHLGTWNQPGGLESDPVMASNLAADVLTKQWREYFIHSKVGDFP